MGTHLLANEFNNVVARATEYGLTVGPTARNLVVNNGFNEFYGNTPTNTSINTFTLGTGTVSVDPRS